MKAEGHDVEILYYQVGMVSSGSEPRPTSLLVPDSRKMASGCLDKVACGRDVVYGYWPHELQLATIGLLPRLVAEKIMVRIAEGEKAKEELALKQL